MKLKSFVISLTLYNKHSDTITAETAEGQLNVQPYDTLPNSKKKIHPTRIPVGCFHDYKHEVEFPESTAGFWLLNNQFLNVLLRF